MAFKSNFFFLALFVIIGLTVVEADFQGLLFQQCGNNEEFELCGSRCPVTCANLAAPPSCRGCAKGCFCRPGFFRTAAGACVLVANCA